jgi:membrane-associated protease RseP (regulator of RpoE activity)
MSEPFELIRPFNRHQVSRDLYYSESPTGREWIRHSVLFILTILTTTLAGALLHIPISLLEPQIPDPTSWLGYLLYIPIYYALIVASLVYQTLSHPSVLLEGLKFSASLLTILTLHEAGHYLACRYYGVAATLPFFIPAPPLFLTGTFGAFIKIKSPIPTRRAIFDIGIAGPLAGFIPALIILIIAILTAEPDTTHFNDAVLVTHDSILSRLLAQALGVDISYIKPNPFYFASWIGLLVTCLNLMPVGQLDGGHVTYALFGTRIHKLIGSIAFAAMVMTALLGWIWYGVPSGIVYAILLFIMLRIRHPQALDETDSLGTGRILIAITTLLIFILSFVPIPITIETL